jgi:hypothetical protein
MMAPYRAGRFKRLNMALLQTTKNDQIDALKNNILGEKSAGRSNWSA